ncbi:MAG: hypothetical protein BGP24_17430 [Lysobacterales bacterium 69-70]|nr:MAG: hypothetical protein ABT27_16610 [Xanthomonadaceae bacterium SCN 69-25]OJZ00296.1 MAG: hypothetical protein BGP24_17430 [Xanthomonadales bacterium 69-70]
MGAPAALVGLSLAFGNSSAQAAADKGGGFVASGETGSAPTFSLLRLSGSALETDSFGNWQESWPQVPSKLARARITVHGFVRATPSTLGALDVESAFFGVNNKVNLALVYSVGDKPSGSGPISFHAEAPNFGGFALTQRGGTGNRSGVLPTATVTLGDAYGRFAPGLYVIVHRPAAGNRIADASQYVYTGYNDRPLILRSGRLPDTDYLSFSVEPA